MRIVAHFAQLYKIYYNCSPTYNPLTMDVLGKYWIDFMTLALGLWFVNGALTGGFYTYPRHGRKELIAQIAPGWGRLVSLLVAIIAFVFVIHDVISKAK